MSVILRPATKSDAAYLLNLEEVCMRGYAEELWGDWRQSDTVESLDVAGHEVIELNGKERSDVLPRSGTKIIFS
ncbi:hypothetical protein NXC12_PE00244 (plasmid) [Rhizobium etli]|uniref:Acetyltransferase protein n=1 Tax=Rhizobium etli TaxID=29449 RepID=A0AAN1EN96_RHIET|nr:hypothetical protein NXC12_PE00244 [Rhizobium etli]